MNHMLPACIDKDFAMVKLELFCSQNWSGNFDGGAAQAALIFEFFGAARAEAVNEVSVVGSWSPSVSVPPTAHVESQRSVAGLRKKARSLRSAVMVSPGSLSKKNLMANRRIASVFERTA